MSNHPFRFQPLLNWAEQREEQQMVVLATALQAEQAALATLEALVRHRDEQLALASEVTRVDPQERQASETYLLHVTAQIEAQRGVVQEARGEVDLARAGLIDIEQEKQSFERLREQDEQQVAEALGRREASAVDDLNMTRHARRGAQDRGVA